MVRVLVYLHAYQLQDLGHQVEDVVYSPWSVAHIHHHWNPTTFWLWNCWILKFYWNVCGNISQRDPPY